MPAYEWDFGDVNPPVQAWAALEVFAIDGGRDFDFLSEVFDKLLVNFTWWVNMEDADGRNLFEGGFMGLDNIGPIDRSHLPVGGVLQQSDATGWMAFYAIAMASIAAVLQRSGRRPAMGVVIKFLEHFAAITQAMDDQGLWDDVDGLYTDRLLTPDGTAVPVKYRSMVGIIPMLTAAVIDEAWYNEALVVGKQLAGFVDRHGLADPDKLSEAGLLRGAPGDRQLLLSVVGTDRLEKLFAKLFDTDEFLSPYGLRALSAYHRDHPYQLDVEGFSATVDYEPAESTTGMFGGNSNWRGPLWFPLNYLVVNVLERYFRFFGDELTIEYPAGSGHKVPLDMIAADLSDRLISLFTVGPDGRRPCFGWVDQLQHDPAWKDNLLFNEYFHGDNGAGLGASHQTGWTGSDRGRDPPPPRRRQLRRRRISCHAQTGPAMTPPTLAPEAASRSVTPTSAPPVSSSRLAPGAAAWPGNPFPLGATVRDGGTNFAVEAGAADAMLVCLFDANGTETQIPLLDCDAGVWHGFVPGAGFGQAYGYRAVGRYDPGSGLRYNPAKLLLDPYARAFSGAVSFGPEVLGYPAGGDPNAPSTLDSAGHVPRSLVVDDTFSWDDAARPRRSYADTVIYEVHVKGFTMAHPGVPPELQGTYAGLGHQAAIGHLVDLGVTAVELLPVHESVPEAFLLQRGLTNYWGYNTIGYFAPHQAYSAQVRAGRPGGQVAEFKAMVDALHQAGLEVLIDVVFNHTTEGNQFGPTLCYRGLDNPAYYRLDPGDPSSYFDTTGCGNSLNVSDPVTLQLIMDSLRYWLTEMHVDGFRFDLAPTLARQDGEFEKRSAFLDMVSQDPVVSRAKLIAEPWDVGQMDSYELGGFPPVWREWNGKYRDSMRDFWRSHPIGLGEFANRFCGSSDLYSSAQRRPTASVNLITVHDGFTLRDLVSYNDKHNEANGESNRDGTSDNRSWNCGAEGPTDDPDVLALRARQTRAMLATLLLSFGIPMLLGGDEMGRTQQGNNNAYCQDNQITWHDWSGRRHRPARVHPPAGGLPQSPPGVPPATVPGRGRRSHRDRLVHPGRHRHDRHRLVRPQRPRHSHLPRRLRRTRPGRRRLAPARRRLPGLGQRLVATTRLHHPRHPRRDDLADGDKHLRSRQTGSRRLAPSGRPAGRRPPLDRRAPRPAAHR